MEIWHMPHWTLGSVRFHIPCRCDHVLFSPFNDKIWLVRLQASSPTPADGIPAQALDPANGIQFFAGTRLLFGCLLSNATVKATGDPLLKTGSQQAQDYGISAFHFRALRYRFLPHTHRRLLYLPHQGRFERTPCPFSRQRYAIFTAALTL